MDQKEYKENYQYKFFEISVDPGTIIARYSPGYPDGIKTKKDALANRAHEIARSVLTKKQLYIFEKICDGYSQVQIAAELGMGQPTINCHLFGMRKYVNGKKVHVWGGLIKKMRKAVVKDDLFLKLSAEILQDIEEWEEIVGL